MPHRVSNFKYSLLGQQGLHLVPGDDVALLESFDSKILAGIFISGQDDFPEVAPAENGHEVEAVESHGGVGPDGQRPRVLSGRLSDVVVAGRPVLSWWSGGGDHLGTRVGDSDHGGVTFLLQSIFRLAGVGRTDDHPGGGVAGRVDDEGLLVRQHHIRWSVGLLPGGSLARRPHLCRRFLTLLVWYTRLLAEVPRLKLLENGIKYKNFPPP